MLYQKLLKIFYFKDKPDLQSILEGCYFEMEPNLELIKANDIYEVEKELYFNWSENYALVFLIFPTKEKIYMHDITVPIKYRRPLSINPRLGLDFFGIISDSSYRAEEIYTYVRKTPRGHNRILIFSIKTNVIKEIKNDEKIKVVEVDDEEEIYKRRFTFDFTIAYNPTYVVLDNKIMKAKNIYEPQAIFKKAESEYIQEWIAAIKNDIDFELYV